MEITEERATPTREAPSTTTAYTCSTGRQGRFEDAIAQAKIAIVEWSGNLYVEGTSHETLARAYMHAGRLAEAADTFQVALPLPREAGYRIGHAVAAWWYG
jgi:hypothetical protein